MKYYLLIIFLVVITTFEVQSKVVDNLVNQNKILPKVQNSIAPDSVKIVRVTDFFNLIKKSNKQNRNKQGLLNFEYCFDEFPDFYNFSDTIIVSPIFLPVIFDGDIIDPNLDFVNTNKYSYTTESIDYDLIPNDSIAGYQQSSNLIKDNNTRFKLLGEEESLQPYIDQMRSINNTRKMYYTSNPENIKIKDDDLSFELPQNISSTFDDNNFKDLLKADEMEIKAPTVNVKQIKQKFWKVYFQNNLDISQTNYTDNWDSQGSSTTQLNSLQRVDATYRKKKIEFTHWTEWKLAIQRWALTDEEKENNKSEFLLNEDYLRMYNKLGLDAFIKRWSYILTIEFKTPLFIKKDKDNRNKKLASLFSPLTMNIGLGAGYNLNWNSKVNKSRKLDLKIDAQPFSLDIKYVGSDEVWNNNNNGVVYADERAGERRYSKFEFGSNVNLTVDYKINSYISFYSRNRFFTNYHKQLIESENTFNFMLNKYLSTKLYFYGRFNDEDPNKKDDKLKYFSYTNSIRFGLSFKW